MGLKAQQAHQNVEVIRRFYHHFINERDLFLASIQGISTETEQMSYITLMLTRLMVLYFLQHKGFLDNDHHHLSHRLRLVQELHGENKFYHEYLLPLFQQKAHISALDPGSRLLLDKLSTLDLFQTYTLEHNNPHIQIPDDAFTRLFRFFDSYHWQLLPQTSQRENQLSPDVFTYIFEQHLNRRQTGAYYTQQDVAAYIAQNTIVSAFLDTLQTKYPTAFASGTIWHLLQTNPDRYISASIQNPEFLPTETEREYTTRRLRYEQLRSMLQTGTICNIHDLISYNLNIHQFALDILLTCEKLDLLLASYASLEQITVLDPTCGTGAFLFAALNTLRPLYAACLTRIQVLTGNTAPLPTLPGQTSPDILLRQTEQDRNRFILASIINNNLYGVDVMKEATDICKLLLFLALLADVAQIEDIKSLPPLNFHLCTGNTLVGFIHAHELDISTHTNLQDHLDSHLATTYGIDQRHFPADYDYKNYLEQWRASHQPFHWFVEFPDVMKRGGFDVIIGNPPYIEYNKVRQEYTVRKYEAESCGNLYAAIIERSLSLCRSGQSYLGLIVPLSICSGKRFNLLRCILTQNSALLWLSNFEIFPSRLFDGVFQRLSILIAKHDRTQQCSLHVTGIQRWYISERPHLIQRIVYTATQYTLKPQVFPKLASPLQGEIIQKVLKRSGGETIATALQRHQTEHFVYYQEATNYWMKATCQTPFYKKNGIVMKPSHGRFLFFQDTLTARTIMALMNSSLFYVWFATYSDGFHLSHALVREFPTGNDLYTITELPLQSLHLEEDIQAHARMSTRNTKSRRQQEGHSIELAEYRMGHSKPILDNIDKVLARYYGFTSDELDFIINYDLKYRMGQKNSNEEV